MGKKAIIIGASSGIGYEVTRLLLSQGWTVGIAARRKEKLETVKASAPGRVWTEVIDVTDEDAPEKLRHLIQMVGGMDLYFHASGIGAMNPELKHPEIEIDTVRTNGLGWTQMVGEAYRFFTGQGHGHIACITSIAGTKGLGPAPAYSATKAFQQTYLQALEQQAHSRHLKIHFTDIRPGFVKTPLLKGSNAFPMQLSVGPVAKAIVKAVYRKRHLKVIDWRWHILTIAWACLPRWIWRNFKL
ncbi:MAG: SDR family NAD(P)-dependent oxidoreductase [Prevotella sp.]|jgi:NADP-dependent 3-hydroxy acid dehydrogenase YdfG|nr:SDR family NAD(P)-dependent oxidoreductase [Prevotella sp.]MCI1246953.1 SDR family NAD(P)-dependent oxidoreductase [Prevotella sp.]